MFALASIVVDVVGLHLPEVFVSSGGESCDGDGAYTEDDH